MKWLQTGLLGRLELPQETKPTHGSQVRASRVPVVPATTSDGVLPRHSGGKRRQKPTMLLLALSLAACQSAPVKIETVEVKVPVAVQPIKPAQVPAVPSPLGPRPQSLSAAADILLADHCKWVAYGLLTDPLLRVSAGEPPQPLPIYPECERR